MERYDKRKLTTVAGAPVGNNTNSLTAGPRGEMMMQDLWYLEKLGHFDREVIPERRMHAKGSGAFGHFTVTHDIAKYTKADVFSEIGKKTDIFIRFSTVAGERGAADAERDIRGFATKFYTEEGNWDLVGNNTPVFFLRDALRFPDLNHAIKRDPRTNMRSKQNNWDFWTMLPEALHQVTIVMSDRGIPRSYRHMHGFGSHTYSMINKNNERVWVKFHMRTMQGIETLSNKEAESLVGMDRESHQKDLYEAIENKDFPRWEMSIQVMTEEEAKNHKENPFDITKVWSQKTFKRIPVGILKLNRNPENYFQDVEQAAFTPMNIVPGIGLSPDKLLQGRVFSYGDAQRYRLGVNHHQIPVNKPKNEVHSYHRDGKMRVDGNVGSTIAYQPNSYGVWEDSPAFDDVERELNGALARYEPKDDLTDNTFYQAGDLYRLITEDKKTVLIQNTIEDIKTVTDNIKYRHTAHCYLADKEYGERLAEGLFLELDKVIELSNMSHDERMQATMIKE